jgi:dienelactone hydrolase
MPIRAMLLALCLASPSVQAQQVSFASVGVGNVAAGPEIKAWIYKPSAAGPSGEGPSPAVVLAHSCAGVTEHTHDWARKIAGWGYLVLEFDSFNPRGEKAVCTKPGTITPNMRVADVAGALDHLSTRPEIVQGRIGLIGHSHGGSVAVRSSQGRFNLAARGLRGAVAYYPGCNPANDGGVALPLLLLTGDNDDWTPADRCRQVVAAASRPELIEAVYYPGAHHSFDLMARDRTVPGGAGRMHHLAYDAVAAPDAESRTKAFFDKLLR